MIRVLLFAISLLLSIPCMAASQGNPANGKAKVYTCTGCHAITGYKNAYPNYHVPKIAGQNYEYLISALSDYKKGARSHPTMRAQGESLSDEDIRDIASYVSSLTPKN